ncbi:Protein T23E7.2 f [Aphelenchoides avenae]|nr:Protein T23E7.2 f [Aphelenchus avenae]
MADAEVPVQNGVAEESKPEEEVEQDTVLVKKFIELEHVSTGDAEKPKDGQPQPAAADDDKTEDQVSDIFAKDGADPMTTSVYGVEDLPKEEAPKETDKPAGENGDIAVSVFIGEKPAETTGDDKPAEVAAEEKPAESAGEEKEKPVDAAGEEKPKEEEPEVAFNFKAPAAAPATPSATTEAGGDVAVEVSFGTKPEEAAPPGTPKSTVAGSEAPGTPKVDSSIPGSPKPTSAAGSVPGTPRSVIAASEHAAEGVEAEGEKKPAAEPAEFVDEERERIKMIEKWARSDRPEDEPPKTPAADEAPKTPVADESKSAEEEKTAGEGDVGVEVFGGEKATEDKPEEKAEEEKKPAAEPAEFVDEERERIKMMERWARSDRAEEPPKTPIDEAPRTPISEPKTPVDELPKTPTEEPRTPEPGKPDEEVEKPAEKTEEAPRTPTRTRRESPSPPRRSPPRRDAAPETTGTRLTTATSFSDWVPRERVSYYSGRQYVPGASHRLWEYQSWFGATPGGSLSYATRLIDRSRSRSIERRREMDYRRSPSAGYYGSYYGSYWTNRTQYPTPLRTREYSIPASISRAPSFVSFRDYRAESGYNLARTTSSDLLSRSS